MTVLYEDNHIIAVNKTCSEIVQGDKTGDTPLSETVKAYIKEKYAKPGAVFLGVTHRLDRPTSGVVLFARTSKALARLNDMFRMHGEIQKTYWAIVKRQPHPAEGRLEDYLFRNEQQNKSYVCNPDRPGAKKAVLDCPIRGDLKYGYERSNPDGGISLHARSIRFVHPVSRQGVYIEAPVPQNDKLWVVMEQLAQANRGK